MRPRGKRIGLGHHLRWTRVDLGGAEGRLKTLLREFVLGIEIESRLELCHGVGGVAAQ